MRRRKIQLEEQLGRLPHTVSLCLDLLNKRPSSGILAACKHFYTCARLNVALLCLLYNSTSLPRAILYVYTVFFISMQYLFHCVSHCKISLLIFCAIRKCKHSLHCLHGLVCTLLSIFILNVTHHVCIVQLCTQLSCTYIHISPIYMYK